MIMDEGLLINIDEGEGKVLQGNLEDKVCNPCSTLRIQFTSKKFMVFTGFEGSCYFRYCGIDWVPIQNRFNQTNEGNLFYDITAVPKTMLKIVDKPAKNASALARSMGLQLTDDSENLELKCPIVGLSAYALIKKHRLVSLQDAAFEKDLGKGVFIYCNSQTMFCSRWSTMCKKQANSLQFTPLEQENVEVTVIDNRPQSHLSVPQTPRAWTENDYLAEMTGVAYLVNMPKNVSFCETYTMKFDDDDLMDAPVSLLCTAASVDLLNSGKFQNIFTQVTMNGGK